MTTFSNTSDPINHQILAIRGAINIIQYMNRDFRFNVWDFNIWLDEKPRFENIQFLEFFLYSSTCENNNQIFNVISSRPRSAMLRNLHMIMIYQH